MTTGTTRPGRIPTNGISSASAVAKNAALLSTFVRRYDFEMARPDVVEIAPRMILHPQGPIMMNVRRA